MSNIIYNIFLITKYWLMCSIICKTFRIKKYWLMFNIVYDNITNNKSINKRVVLFIRQILAYVKYYLVLITKVLIGSY